MANIELTQLKGIGPSIVEKLNLVGIFNLRDLCFHLPFGYQDRTKISYISELQPGDEKLIKVNLLVQSEINNLIIKNMIKKKLKGKIIHISSIAGVESIASIGYSVAKAALTVYSKKLASLFLKKNIFIKTLILGAFETNDNSGGGESDTLYDEAVAFVLDSQKASISSVQRKLRIGYNRAARLIEQMEESGVVSPMSSNGTREILVPAGR